MTNPASVLRNILRVGDSVHLWTHYYDAAALGKTAAPNPHLNGEYDLEDGFRLWRYSYNVALEWDGFCGGPMNHSRWMEKKDILSIIATAGHTVMHETDTPDHPNGPCTMMFLSRMT
jgi:hypothetical protein